MMFVTLKKIKIRYNLILFALNFVFVFVIGLVPENSFFDEIYSLGVSGIFFASILSVSDKHIKYLFVAIAITVLTWVSTYLKLNAVQHFTSIASLAFFFYIIVLLVIQIARSHQVGALEFLKAVNIYFLFGIMGAIVFRTIFLDNPNAISFNDGIHFAPTDFVYLSFVTMTTVGFGDITPISPLARNMAIFLSFSGQLYLTMIVALLVGKYLTGKQMQTPQVPNHVLPVNPEVMPPKPPHAEDVTKKSDPE
ncbi:MAG: ion channel [Bacteroidales bacterium]|jgi:hypothetical protein